MDADTGPVGAVLGATFGPLGATVGVVVDERRLAVGLSVGTAVDATPGLDAGEATTIDIEDTDHEA